MDTIDLGGREILVVDDVRFTRLTLTKMIAGLGAPNIIEAEDGQSALDILARSDSRVDCVISDIEMPGLDGLELLRAIRTGERNIRNDLPVIVLTGHSEFERLGPALLLDLDAFLIKPVSKAAIERCLGRVFGAHAHRRIAGAEAYRGLDLTGTPVSASLSPGTGNANERCVKLDELDAGDVLARDLVFANGRLLLPANTRLNGGTVARLVEIAAVSNLTDEAWIAE